METQQQKQQLHHQVVNVQGINIASYQRAQDGQWIVLVTQPTPKGRYSQYKVLHHYRFGLEARLTQWINSYVDQLNAQAKRKEEARDAKSAARKAAVNPFKVGDMFYDSWGYEQTNIDFYQITEVGKMSVTLKRIGGKAMPSQGGSPMSGQVAAVKDSFYSDGHHKGGEMKRIVQVTMWNGKVGYGIKGQYNDHGYLTRTTGSESHYESWYA